MSRSNSNAVELTLDDGLIRLDQAAAILGLQLSTLRAWRAARKIEVVRVGARSVRVKLSEIRRLISAGTIPARPER